MKNSKPTLKRLFGGGLAFALLLITAPWALAQETETKPQPADVTRVSISTIGTQPVRYQISRQEAPPAITIEFLTRNVISRMPERVELNRGVIRVIETSYYRGPRRGEAARPVRALMVFLLEPAPFSIGERAGAIWIDITQPKGVIAEDAAREVIEIGAAGEAEEVARGRAMTETLAQVAGGTPGVLGPSVLPEQDLRQAIRQEALLKAQSTGIEWPMAKAVVAPPAIIPIERELLAHLPPGGQPVRGVGWLWWILVLGGLAAGLWVWWRRIGIFWVWRRRAQEEIAKVTALSEPVAETAAQLQRTTNLERLVLNGLGVKGFQLESTKPLEGAGNLIRLTKEKKPYGVFCVPGAGYVERELLERVLQGMAEAELREGFIITTGTFTAPAQKLAQEGGLTLVDRNTILDWISPGLNAVAVNPSTEVPETSSQELERQLTLKEAELQNLLEQIKAAQESLAAKEQLTEELRCEQGQVKAQLALVEQRAQDELTQRQGLEAQLAKIDGDLKALQEELIKREAALQEAKGSAQAQLAQAVLEAPVPEAPALEAKPPRRAKVRRWEGGGHRRWARLALAKLKDRGRVLLRCLSKTGAPLYVDARDLGAGGVSVDVRSDVEFPKEFRLQLFLPDRSSPLEATGTIVWSGQGEQPWLKRIGAKFSAITPKSRAKIRRYVEKERAAGASSEI